MCCIIMCYIMVFQGISDSIMSTCVNLVLFLCGHPSISISDSAFNHTLYYVLYYGISEYLRV